MPLKEKSDQAMRFKVRPNQLNHLFIITRSKAIILLCLSQLLIRPQAHAKPWAQHSSEAEVYEQIYNLLLEAELPPQKIKRGSYPLYLNKQNRSIFPLLSTPCPILSDCESLLKSIRAKILRSGYHLVYPDRSPRPDGPLHFAIAKGNQAVMALRLLPTTSTATLLYHISATNELMRSDIQALPIHLTLVLSDQDILQNPNLSTWLDAESREYLIKLDPLAIKRALIHPNSGKLFTTASERAKAIKQLLTDIIKRSPGSIGFYIDQDVNLTLDRVMLDQLMLTCSKYHQVLALSRLSDPLIHALALASGIRSFKFDELVNSKQLKNTLKSLEARLVIEGEVNSEFQMTSVETKSKFIRWLKNIKQRQVMILRLSESAW